MERRRAKDPEGKGALPFAWRYKNNQDILDYLCKSLVNRLEITRALHYDNTPQGICFWSDYQNKDKNAMEAESFIREYINLLAIPIKPFDRKDWL